MKLLRQRGLAVDKIADVINSEGIKPRAGIRWYATSVYRILKASGGAKKGHADSIPARQLPGPKEGFRKFRGVRPKQEGIQ